jgi:inner membrane protein
MMGKTHLAIGLLAGLAVYPFVESWGMLFFPLVLVGALLPDVDHEGSTFNKKFPLTRWIPLFFEHRGVFHSLFPPMIVVIVAAFMGYAWMGAAIALGYISHLLSDSLTRLGTRPFHPLWNFRLNGFISTGGILELVMLVIVGALDLWLLARNGLIL